MGQQISHMYSAYIGSPDTAPNYREPPTFDPSYGFPNGRQEKVAKLTEQEMETANIPHEYRDYCAHLLIPFYQCRRQRFPWVAACKAELHHWQDCENDEGVSQMMEYEREKRLLARAKRKALKAQKEELGH